MVKRMSAKEHGHAPSVPGPGPSGGEAPATSHTQDGFGGRLGALVTASFDVMYRMNPDWSVMRLLNFGDTSTPNPHWLDDYIHQEDQADFMARVGEAIR